LVAILAIKNKQIEMTNRSYDFLAWFEAPHLCAFGPVQTVQVD
jgi:hypothetical protein